MGILYISTTETMTTAVWNWKEYCPETGEVQSFKMSNTSETETEENTE